MSSKFSDEDVQRIGQTIGDGLAEIRANAARVPEIEKKVDILTERHFESLDRGMVVDAIGMNHSAQSR